MVLKIEKLLQDQYPVEDAIREKPIQWDPQHHVLGGFRYINFQFNLISCNVTKSFSWGANEQGTC